MGYGQVKKKFPKVIWSHIYFIYVRRRSFTAVMYPELGSVQLLKNMSIFLMTDAHVRRKILAAMRSLVETLYNLSDRNN